MQKLSESIEAAVAEIDSAFRDICGVGAGSGYTLQPHATRANVVAMTERYGFSHLNELADGLTRLSAQDTQLFAQLISSHNVVDLNCGAGFSGLLIAMLAGNEATNPTLVFVDHAKAAVDFAVELAAWLGVNASGVVVVKQFVGAPVGELPDHSGLLASAVLMPAVPQLSGATTIVAGHALSCHKFAPGNRQANLHLQNRLALAQVDQALARDSDLYLLQCDIDTHSLTMHDFVAMIRASGNSSAPRPMGKLFRARPSNRTPGKEGRHKYFAAQRLEALPCVDNLVAWSVSDFEILLSESEVEALIGERASPAHYPDLQRLLAQEVR